MSLINTETKWVLFLSSQKDPEDRHILDLVFGLHCLETAGVDPKNIHIYIDGSNRATIENLIKIASKNIYKIKKSSEFSVDQTNNHYKNLVLFVSGHGGIEGIDANPPLKPHQLLADIKKSPNLEKAIVFLGQCYAGIFNYIGAGKAKVGPDVIFIGATNLHSSLSASTTETFQGNQSIPWVANFFLLFVFKWISQPFDVDGDGKCTIMDAYKFSGAMSNNKNKQLKISSFVQSFDLHEKWKLAREDHAKQNSPTSQIALDAATQRYENVLNSKYVHQECWILNAIPAQSIEL